MPRKSNGQGHTYKVGASYRTVIRHNGSTITAMAKTYQESRKKAKEKLDAHNPWKRLLIHVDSAAI